MVAHQDPTAAPEQQPAERAPPRRKQRSPRWRRWNGIAIGAAAALAIALLATHAVKHDERVGSAVADSVVLLNATLYERLNLTLDALATRLTSLQGALPGIKASPAERTRPGQVAAQQGLRAHHPVVIVPGGLWTSGLELWQGHPCAQAYFRQRLWGSMTMAQTLLSDRDCWLRHMALDPDSGSDPPGIKLRAVRSLEALDYFIQGYWVFAKLLQTLADIGYDSNNLVGLPYDWRLPLPVMETRDHYFSLLKEQLEFQGFASGGIKPLLISHSYGAVVVSAFLAWVSQDDPSWVGRCLAGYVNLAGALLGVPKVLPPLLSGETRELADLQFGLAFVADQFLNKSARIQMARSWGSTLAMVPVGGDRVWGNSTWAPDDDDAIRAANRSFGAIIARVSTSDAQLEASLESNSTSNISSEDMGLLRSTLHNFALGGGGGSSGKPPPEVEFLDAQQAVRLLGMEGGARFARNLRRWAPAGKAEDAELAALAAPAEKPNAGGRGGRGGGGGGSAPRGGAAAEGQRCEVDANGDGSGSGTCAAGSGAGAPRSRWAAATGWLVRLWGGSVDAAAGAADDAADAGRAAGEGGVPGTPADAGGAGKGEGGAAAAHGGSGGGGPSRGGLSELLASVVEAAGHGEETVEQLLTQVQEQLSRAVAEPVVGGVVSVAGRVSDALTGVTDSVGASVSSTVAGAVHRALDAVAAATDARRRTRAAVEAVNPLTTPLPAAPQLRVYCMYGVGIPTDRAFHYMRNQPKQQQQQQQQQGGSAGAADGGEAASDTRQDWGLPAPQGTPAWVLNTLATDAASGLEAGVQFSDGDGTVPLLSLGALCEGGWSTSKRLNPANASVVVREYRHKASSWDSRGGPGASSHVELLGNEELLLDVARIAAGRGRSVERRVVSDVTRIAGAIPWDELAGGGSGGGGGSGAAAAAAAAGAS